MQFAFDLCHRAIIYVSLILCALGAKWCRRPSNESSLDNECMHCRDLFTSLHIKIAQLCPVASLEVRSASGNSDSQQRPTKWPVNVRSHFPSSSSFFFFYWGWGLFVLQWSVRMQSSEDGGRQFRWEEKEALSLARLWRALPGDVRGQRAGWSDKVVRERERESKWRGKNCISKGLMDEVVDDWRGRTHLFHHAMAILMLSYPSGLCYWY